MPGMCMWPMLRRSILPGKATMPGRGTVRIRSALAAVFRILNDELGRLRRLLPGGGPRRLHRRGAGARPPQVQPQRFRGAAGDRAGHPPAGAHHAPAAPDRRGRIALSRHLASLRPIARARHRGAGAGHDGARHAAHRRALRIRRAPPRLRRLPPDAGPSRAEGARGRGTCAGGAVRAALRPGVFLDRARLRAGHGGDAARVFARARPVPGPAAAGRGRAAAPSRGAGPAAAAGRGRGPGLGVHRAGRRSGGGGRAQPAPAQRQCRRAAAGGDRGHRRGAHHGDVLRRSRGARRAGGAAAAVALRAAEDPCAAAGAQAGAGEGAGVSRPGGAGGKGRVVGKGCCWASLRPAPAYEDRAAAIS